MLMNHFANPAIPHFACVCVGTSARARYCDAVAEAAAATGMRRGQTDKQTNEKTLEHADAHTNEAKYTHACLHTHTHTQTRARAPTHAATHPRARQQQQHREINTDARKHTPNHSANKADSTRRCKWTKQQRLDEARRAHAKTEKGAAMNKETCQFAPHLIVHVGGFFKTLWPSG